MDEKNMIRAELKLKEGRTIVTEVPYPPPETKEDIEDIPESGTTIILEPRMFKLIEMRGKTAYYEEQ